MLLATGAAFASAGARGDDADAAHVRPQTWAGHTVVRTDRPPVAAMTVTDRATQLAAAVNFAVRRHVDAVKPERNDALPDGSSYIAERLVTAVLTYRGARPAAIGPVATDEKNAGPISSAAAGADLVVDVRSTPVGVHELPTGPRGRFVVGVGIEARVYDVRERHRIAERACLGHRSEPATLEELEADGYAQLKARLRVLWDACVVDLATGLLELTPDEARGLVAPSPAPSPAPPGR
ncbi:MAG: hypothetical protein JSR54_19510 [Proteobacteria bacterium]|nr:hypothetical protein [Pseudomonadota bacterium]